MGHNETKLINIDRSVGRLIGQYRQMAKVQGPSSKDLLNSHYLIGLASY